MNKILTIISLLLFTIAIAVPAIAGDNGNCTSCNNGVSKSSVQVNAEIEISKEKNVMEDIYIDKEYTVRVKQKVKPTGSAEAQAVKEDHNMNNTVTEDPGTKKVEATRAYIKSGAVDSASGIVNINQSPGNVNNQGNAVSVSMTDSKDSFIHSESAATEINEGNKLSSRWLEKRNEIENAGIGISGLTGINQSAGNMNNQNNASSLAVGKTSIAALSEADLGMVNTNNVSCEIHVNKSDRIVGSAFNGASGITSINQSAGSMNNQANVVSASVNMTN